MEYVYIVSEDCDHEGSVTLAVCSTEQKAEQRAAQQVIKRRTFATWNEGNRKPGESARWETKGGSWIAWERHRVL